MLMIENAYISLQDFDTATEDWHALEIFLKLSQENDMTPGLLLPVAAVYAPATGTTNPSGFTIDQLGDRLAGTIWAPRNVAVRVIERGAVVAYQLELHLDYHKVDVPWMDWFIAWDYLDNVVDETVEY